MKRFVAPLAVAVMLIGVAPALALTPASTSTTPSSNCISLAVDTREGAIGSAFSAYSTAMTTSLLARKVALSAAWNMTDPKTRRAARDAAWSTYAAAAKSAHATLKAARTAAWSTFASASKTCGVPVVEKSSSDAPGTIGL